MAKKKRECMQSGLDHWINTQEYFDKRTECPRCGAVLQVPTVDYERSKKMTPPDEEKVYVIKVPPHQP